MRMLSATQQTQEEVERTKQQLSFEIDRIKQEGDMKVGVQDDFCETVDLLMEGAAIRCSMLLFF